MPRRAPYTKVKKNYQLRADHVKGMGDVVFKVFQCLNYKCKKMLSIRKDEISDDFEITCPDCSFVFKSGEVTKFYDYELIDKRNNVKIEEGEFLILHDDYINEVVDQLLSKYAAYFPEIIKIRNRILTHTGLDFFKFSRTISKKWIESADEQLT